MKNTVFSINLVKVMFSSFYISNLYSEEENPYEQIQSYAIDYKSNTLLIRYKSVGKGNDQVSNMKIIDLSSSKVLHKV